MKIGRLLVLAWILSALTACGGPEQRQGEPTSGAAPASRGPIELLDGGRIEAEAMRGRWLVVNYWAAWCRPCLEEIPELNAFDAAHENVLVVGVNYDRPPAEKARAQARKLGIEFAVAAGLAPKWMPFEPPEVLPSTFVLNPRGELVAKLRGAQTRASLANAIGE